MIKEDQESAAILAPLWTEQLRTLSSSQYKNADDCLVQISRRVCKPGVIFLLVRFAFTQRKTGAKQSASLQTRWELSLFWLARRVRGRGKNANKERRLFDLNYFGNTPHNYTSSVHFEDSSWKFIAASHFAKMKFSLSRTRWADTTQRTQEAQFYRCIWQSILWILKYKNILLHPKCKAHLAAYTWQFYYLFISFHLIFYVKHPHEYMLLGTDYNQSPKMCLFLPFFHFFGSSSQSL